MSFDRGACPSAGETGAYEDMLSLLPKVKLVSLALALLLLPLKLKLLIFEFGQNRSGEERMHPRALGSRRVGSFFALLLPRGRADELGIPKWLSAVRWRAHSSIIAARPRNAKFSKFVNLLLGIRSVGIPEQSARSPVRVGVVVVSSP